MLANSAVVTVVGKPVQEIIGKDDTNLFSGDEAQHLMSQDRLVMAQPGPHTYEEQLTTPHGKRFFLATKGAIRDENGNVAGLFGIARDITERKQIEETLLFLLHSGSVKTGESFFELLARHLAGCLEMEYVCIDRLEGDGLEALTLAVYHDGKFEGNVQYALKDTPCGDVVGQTICLFPRDVSKLFPRDPALQGLKAESYIGTTLWSHDGHPIGLIAVIGRKSLTNPGLAESILKLVALRAASELERMQAEEELKSSEERYRLLTTITSDYVCSCSRCGTSDFRLRWMAGAVESITGYSVEEFYQMGCLKSIIHPDDMERVNGFLKDSIPGKKDIIKFRIITKEGDVRWIQESCYCEQGEAGELLRYGSSQDVTEQELLRDQLVIKEKLESLGLLAGGIAHNFNNILTGILGNISLAQMFLDPAHKSCNPLTEAENASMRAGELARQLLTFGQGGEPSKKVVSIRRLLDEAVSRLPQESNVKVNVDIPDSIHTIEADGDQIGQAFSNIVINAAQAMPGGGLLEIKAWNEILGDTNSLSLPSGTYVRISFADQGCGITDDNLKRIFIPYFSTKMAGNGLGLALAHSIIERHGGNISVNTTVGNGTVFTVYLPAIGENEAMSGTDTDAHAAGSHGGRSILVMDDEEMIRELSSEMLICLGYQVTTCGDGLEAITHYKSALQSGVPFSAVIMDLTIPGGMGGKEAAQQILAIDPKARLVVSSGYSNDPIMANHSAYGFCESVAKPYKIQDLMQALSFLPQSGL